MGLEKMTGLRSWRNLVGLLAAFLLLPTISIADGLARGAEVVSSTDIPIPDDAQAQGQYGTVRVVGVIDEAGSVVDLAIAQSSRSTILDAAALSGVSKWKFRPALDAEGHPTRQKFHTDVEFDPLDVGELNSYTCRKVTTETDWYVKTYSEDSEENSRMYLLLSSAGILFHRPGFPHDRAGFKRVWDKTISACRTSPNAIFIRKFVESGR
ncbi:MAG: Protein TonB [Caulobacter sp.]|nr:Protein TonB [Caulobacter sp.]